MALSSTKQELFCEFELDIYASFLVTLFYHIIHMPLYRILNKDKR